MGILSWWKGGSNNNKQSRQPDNSKANSNANAMTTEVPGLNGAVEVPRPPPKITVFEFGTVAASADKVTLVGYCPVSDDLEPCRWEILPASADDAPQFRIAF